MTDSERETDRERERDIDRAIVTKEHLQPQILNPESLL